MHGTMHLLRKVKALLLSINNMICLSMANGKNLLQKNILIRINPANEEKLSEVADANAADVDKAVKAARNAYEKVWKKMPAKERAKYIFRIARMIQEKARELAIIESLDGGKPIRESRDFDVPTAANHFFYYAGWADKLEYAFPNRQHRTIGCCRTDHSLEFSFADGCMENCTGISNR